MLGIRPSIVAYNDAMFRSAALGGTEIC